MTPTTPEKRSVSTYKHSKLHNGNQHETYNRANTLMSLIRPFKIVFSRNPIVDDFLKKLKTKEDILNPNLASRQTNRAGINALDSAEKFGTKKTLIKKVVAPMHTRTLRLTKKRSAATAPALAIGNKKPSLVHGISSKTTSKQSSVATSGLASNGKKKSNLGREIRQGKTLSRSRSINSLKENQLLALIKPLRLVIKRNFVLDTWAKHSRARLSVESPAKAKGRKPKRTLGRN